MFKHFLVLILVCGSFTPFLNADIVVNTTADENDGDTSSVANLIANSGGTGISLREAILAVNNDTSETTILFDASVFPEETPAKIVLDTATHGGGFSVTGQDTVIDATARGVIIEVDTNETILDITAENFQVMGLELRNIQITQQGILVDIKNNAHGELTDNVLLGNVSVCVRVRGISSQPLNITNNDIGFGKMGIDIADRALVNIEGNYVGVNKEEFQLGILDYGIRIQQNVDHSSFTIKDNVIGYTVIDALHVNSSGSLEPGSLTVLGNQIGMMDTGSGWVGISGYLSFVSKGIEIIRFQGDVTIGGDNPSDGNFIGDYKILGTAILAYDVIGDLTLKNNYIGTNDLGEDFGNGWGLQIGVIESSSGQVIVGGAGSGNVIGHSAFNTSIFTDKPIVFQGNYVGVDRNWNDIDFGNGNILVEISIAQGASAVPLIGGSNPGEGNYISGSSYAGLVLRGSGVVQGNYFGTNEHGDNFGLAKAISVMEGDVIIGGSAPGEGNVFGFTKCSIYDTSSSINLKIQGNYFGTDQQWRDLGDGVDQHIRFDSIGNSNNYTIGGTQPGEGNVFAFAKNVAAIDIDSIGIADTLKIQGNYFGTNALGMDLGNECGILIDNSSTGLLIGSDDPALDNSGANVIAFNKEYGIFLKDSDVSGVTIRGNSIHSNQLGAIAFLSGANDGITPPTLSPIVGNTISGSGALPSAKIDIYKNPLTEDQAREWIAETTADSSGNFSIVIPGLVLGRITATQTDVLGTKSTSALSSSQLTSKIFIDNGEVNSNDLNQFTFGGLDGGDAQYLPGELLNNTTLSISGTGEAFTTIFGTEFYEGSEALTHSQLFLTSPLPFATTTPNSGTTKLTGFSVDQDQQGVLADPSKLPNTLIQATGDYASGETVLWLWKVRPEPEQKDLSSNLQKSFSVLDSNAVIANFEIVDHSQSGIFLESFRVRFSEGAPGALSALSNLKIYLDDGTIPNEWDPDDTGVSTTLLTPALDNSISLDLGSSIHRTVIGETKNYLVVCKVDPLGFSIPQQLTIDINFNETIGGSLLHNSTLNWQNSVNVSRTFSVSEFPGVITVDTPDETPDGGDTSGVVPLILNPGSNGISLGEAIKAVLADPMLASINFDTTVFPPGSPQVISLVTAYDTILRDGVIIDASNSGVILDGSNLTEGSGLNFKAENCEVYGLQVQNFPDHGIQVSGGNVIIGGGSSGQGNVIVSNQKSGIFYQSTNSLPTRIVGNLIGTDASGTALGNTYGIQIVEEAGFVTVGDTGSGERNTIVHSVIDQIHINLSPASSGAMVNIKNNLIGTGDSYDVPKGSGQDGIHVSVNGNHNVTIGGTGFNDGNEIGYQARGGIALVSSSQSITIQGNHIGVSRTGVSMPNLIGVGFVESGNHLVGSSDPSIDNSGANTIAHNITWGILGFGNGSVFNEFRGNSIHSNGIAAVSHAAGSNFEIPAPTVHLDQNRVSGSIIFTDFADSAQVDIFKNNPGENQQREYVGQATVFTTGPNTGNFEFDVPNIQLGDNYTAVMTILSNTSAPASSISVPAFQATQSSELESDGSFSITGTALPNSTIHLIIDGVIVATTTADANGNYSFNLTIDLDTLSYTIEMVLDDGQTFSLDSDILYSGHARVFGFDRHYRTEDFIRGLQTIELSEALNDFEANIDLNDGDDYEVHLHDAANNIIDITREGENHVVTNGPMNEIQSIGTFRTNVQYDTIGRLTSYTETVNSNTRHYRLTWNYRDQLSLIESSSDGVNYSPVSAYAYYPTGMRSSKYIFATNKRQNYYGVNNQVCEVYEFDGILGTEPSGPTQEFIYEGLDKPIAMFTNADGNGFTGAKGGREVYFYHCNPKGDVYALTAGEDTDDFSEGDIVERYDYSLFGDTYVMNEAYQLTDASGSPVTEWQDSKSSFGQPFRFGGAWTDDESGYIWMRHRFYDSRMRGFLSRDPVEEFPLRDIYQTYALTDPTMTGSLGNLYAAFGNNPGTMIDPYGLYSWEAMKAKSNAFKEKVKQKAKNIYKKSYFGQKGMRKSNKSYMKIEKNLALQIMSGEMMESGMAWGSLLRAAIKSSGKYSRRLFKSTGSPAQWLRFGKSYSRSGEFKTRFSVSWGSSPRYVRQIRSKKLRRLNKRFRKTKIPGKSWRSADPGHFHFWK